MSLLGQVKRKIESVIKRGRRAFVVDEPITVTDADGRTHECKSIIPSGNTVLCFGFDGTVKTIQVEKTEKQGGKK